MAYERITKKKILRDIQDLPAIPKIVNQLRDMVTSPETSAREIASLIEHDEALTARVIRICNSAYFGLVRSIVSVPQAVAYLGMKTLYNLVLAGSISELFQRALAGYRHKRGELWEHALYTAFCGELITKKKGLKQLGHTAFTAGLLHDVGKLILNEYLKGFMDEIIKEIKKEDVTWLMAEKNVVGFTHTEIGAAVAKKWRFGNELIVPILHHHMPLHCREHKEIVNIIHIATGIAIKEGYAAGIDAPHYRFSRNVLIMLGIDKDDIKSIVTFMRNNFDPSVMY